MRKRVTINYAKFKFCILKLKLHCELHKCNKIAVQDVCRNQTKHLFSLAAPLHFLSKRYIPYSGPPFDPLFPKHKV